MRIGIFGGAAVDQGLDAVRRAAAGAESEGFASFWLPQIFGLDALAALTLIGAETPRIELGTAVVPTYPRHPVTLAAQALTVQAASGGRLTLGIGLSHQFVIEAMFGYSFDRPARHMDEYLRALVPLLHGEAADVDGETVRAHAQIAVPGTEAPALLVAALGPRMLQLTAERADGTITWMTGPRTLEEFTVPTLRAAAAAAGRPEPRVAVGLPICVTDDPDGARARAAQIFEVYGHLPSYRAMLDREGAAGPADVALVGDEAAVTASVQRLADVGVTDFAAAEFGGSADEVRRTRDTLRGLL
ncbi:MAG: LLM class F420-dependent oxidoreductase [Actinomycetes bacterium]